MQWDPKDETDCRVAGRGDEEQKLMIWVGQYEFQDFVQVMLAILQNYVHVSYEINFILISIKVGLMYTLL